MVFEKYFCFRKKPKINYKTHLYCQSDKDVNNITFIANFINPIVKK